MQSSFLTPTTRKIDARLFEHVEIDDLAVKSDASNAGIAPIANHFLFLYSQVRRMSMRRNGRGRTYVFPAVSSVS